MLTRRQLLQSTLLTIVPHVAQAQLPKLIRIGALYLGLADAESFRKELREGMHELGYVEGRNIAFEFRSVDGKVDQLDRLPELAAELVRLNVDVIVALYVPCALAAKAATRDIPIVILAGDPVETGIVPNLAHPGGNITGVSLMAAASHGKSVELFRDMLPAVRRIGVLGQATNPVFAKAMLDHIESAGRQLAIPIQPIVRVRTNEELESAFATFAKARVSAVIVQGSLAIQPVADLAIKYHVPAASTTHVFADIGGLMVYGADGPTTFRHGVKFVHRILRGRQPKELPIEQPTKFELVLNMRTAKALGLTIPPSLLLRVTQVID